MSNLVPIIESLNLKVHELCVVLVTNLYYYNIFRVGYLEGHN